MGLTIHYSLKSSTRSPRQAEALVERMRQLALDLPFDVVDGQINHVGPDVCQRPLDDLRDNQPLFSSVLDACQNVPIPWHVSGQQGPLGARRPGHDTVPGCDRCVNHRRRVGGIRAEAGGSKRRHPPCHGPRRRGASVSRGVRHMQVGRENRQRVCCQTDRSRSPEAPAAA